MTALPFPWIELDEHPSGCPQECPAKLHLTPAALATLRRSGVSEGQIRQVLSTELAQHTRLSAAKLYPGIPPTWTPAVERTLLELGVPVEIVARAQQQVESSARSGALRESGLLAARQEREKSWKSSNKERVAEHSRAYRARKRLSLVP